MFNTINLDLRIAIINWFTENVNRWQRVNSCTQEFRDYIYNKEGTEYLIGGKNVYEFIKYIDKAF